VEAGNIQHKEKRRNPGALSGTNHDQEQNLRGILEDESTLASGEEGLDPPYQISRTPPFGVDTSQLVGTDIVKTPFDIQKKTFHFEGGSLEKAY